jgi:putative membrane protein
MPDEAQTSSTETEASHQRQSDIPTPQNKKSKVATVWVTLAAFLIILILLIVFILQNSTSVHISYLGSHGTVQFGLAMLIAAVAGAVLTFLIGTTRIIQLKLSRRRDNI